MRSEKNILVAFILNFCFSIFEIIGGFFTGSIAIISDAVHDLGDAISIGFSYFFERKSKKEPNNNYTYGYLRYSVLGAVITNTILIVGSVLVVYNAILRIIEPKDINYNGMIIFAIFGFVINFIALLATRHGESMNEKAVNLHMLEDTLGWIVVLIGAVVIRFTQLTIIDPIMSILVALFILVHAIRSFKEILDLFLEKTPVGVCVNELKEHLLEIENVLDVHHIHVWSMDGNNNYATLHVVTNSNDNCELKNKIREELKEHHINHVTIEIECEGEECLEHCCKVCQNTSNGHGHHHHHHHH